MKKLSVFAIVLAASCLFMVGTALAAYETQVDSYNVHIKVNENNSFDVMETMEVRLNSAKREFYRLIPLQNEYIRSDGEKVAKDVTITGVSVDGRFSESTANISGKLFKSIKISDPDGAAEDVKSYQLKYTYALGKDTATGYDEIYFSIVGDSWTESIIDDITFEIEMPKSFDASKVKFVSLKADGSDVKYTVDGRTIKGSYDGSLFAGEALTLRVELPEGYFIDDTNKTKWTVNNPDIAIFSPDVQGDGVYHVEYNDVAAELVPEKDNIRLLMLNGGFVSDPQIVVENDRTLVPVRIISEVLGAKVDWDDATKTATITDGDNVIILRINNVQAIVNGKYELLDTPPKIIDSKTYIPFRFIAEALEAEVEYVPNLLGRSNVSAVVIEKVRAGADTITPAQGLELAKKASAQTYETLLAYYKETERTFDEVNKDYDSQAITYTGESIGRYYVYSLKGFESFKILVNKYTGAIYCEQPGLPVLSIGEGFVNIPWLYQ